MSVKKTLIDYNIMYIQLQFPQSLVTFLFTYMFLIKKLTLLNNTIILYTCGK